MPAPLLLLALVALLGVGACAAPDFELGPGVPVPPPPLVAPEPTEILEGGTGAGPMQDILLVRVLEANGARSPDRVVWADGAHGRIEGVTGPDGEVRLRGVSAPCDVHVFGDSLYRTLLDVASAALTVRLGDGRQSPPERRLLDTTVRGLEGLPQAPVRFGHVRHWAWPGAGALRPGLPISEDVAVRGPGLGPELADVRVRVPQVSQGALLTLFGTTEQTRLTSWGREVGWDAVSHLTLTALPDPEDPEAGPIDDIAVGVPLSERVHVDFPEARRHNTLLGASDWEVRYELVHPLWGATRALEAGGGTAEFYRTDLELRTPAAADGFEDVRFALTIRAYQGDWWVAERSMIVARDAPVLIEGFPMGRPGRWREGRDLELTMPLEGRFARVIFQATEVRWWVDMLDKERRDVRLPEVPVDRPDPLARPESPLMRAYYFDVLDPQAWSADTAHRFVSHGVSVER